MRIVGLAQRSEACRWVMGIPGIGPFTATALVAAAGDAKVFRSGWETAA